MTEDRSSRPAQDKPVDMNTLVSLCKRRGFVFPSSEIYGGIGSTWDYGPLGVELKRNLKEAWWRAVVRSRDDMVGLDAAILMHPNVWVASGHVAGFSDPLVECKACHQRFRPDQVLVRAVSVQGRRLGYASGLEPSQVQARWQQMLPIPPPGTMQMFEVEPPEPRTLKDFLDDTSEIPCPACSAVGQFTGARQFNLMFETFAGPVKDEAAKVYLRPETAQGIFVNFQNVVASTRKKLPFGIAQIGKSFRNEITPGNFIFRTREFEQMEIEYFVRPEDGFRSLEEWKEERLRWYHSLGIDPAHLRLREHGTDELAHYAKKTYDVEYLFPWGWAELEGIAYRGDFDLSQHQTHSGKALTYFDEERNEHLVPHVVEPSGGVDRALLAFLVDSYREEEVRGEKRTVLRLHKDLAPMKVAVLPLSRNERLVPKAREVYALVRKHWMADYDDAQSIGRRYRRQDETGTPYCVTVDFQTVEQDNAVTIRDRDSMEQVRVPVPELVEALRERLEG